MLYNRKPRLVYISTKVSAVLMPARYAPCKELD